MLVLSRRVGEEIVIDGTIRIRVVAVQGNRVRLGITAPADIPVHREEVAQRELAAAVVPEGIAPPLSDSHTLLP
jgi:carbon storage regulator